MALYKLVRRTRFISANNFGNDLKIIRFEVVSWPSVVSGD